ncbi:MAG: putative undecaprenyl-phosphate N-acetylglucosaminyl 1-phosphate transferase [Phycisphaerae bacterium]|nr:putative undecaprenyl-phosphate N-acetylglucosaminyl 1-phosphate transferase [Phycisphaerae bacterium]
MLLMATLLLGGSLVLGGLLTMVMAPLSRRIGLIDRPGGHKQHAVATPLGGGIAIFLTIAIVMLAGTAAVHLLDGLATQGHRPAWMPPVVWVNLPGLLSRVPAALILLAGAAAMFVLGLVDDYRPLGPLAKFVVEAAVALAVVLLLKLAVVEAFLPRPIAIALPVFWIVAIVNAINFMDNMDGLAAGVVALCGLVFTAAAAVNGQLFVPALLLVVVGAAGGFLLFNFPPARIFMGDSGSSVLGYFLGVLTVQTTYTNDFAAHPAAVFMPLIILAIPLYDMASVTLVRLVQRRSIARGDHSHFSHRLVGRGMTPRAAVLTIYLAVLATGLASVFLMQVPAALAWIVVVQTLCIVGIIALLEVATSRRDQPEP